MVINAVGFKLMGEALGQYSAGLCIRRLSKFGYGSPQSPPMPEKPTLSQVDPDVAWISEYIIPCLRIFEEFRLEVGIDIGDQG